MWFSNNRLSIYGKEAIIFAKLGKNKKRIKQNGEELSEYELELEEDYFGWHSNSKIIELIKHQ